MTEIANFKHEPGGAEAATILETDDRIVEVQKLNDGAFSLIVHSRRPDSDQWDDLSATLKPRDFAVLGSIATMGAQCDCGAPNDGKWASVHSARCSSLG